MQRQPLEIRDARPEDLESLIELWHKAVPSASAPQPARPAAEVRAALAHLAADSDERLLVGLHEGVVVAAIHLRRAPISPVHIEMAVHSSFLLVMPEFRKHGYARGLLEAAVAWAEEKDAAHVTAITSSANRDTNRFLARLGLAEIAKIRAAETSALRHKLAPEPIRPNPSRRNLGRVLAQRRSMRKVAPDAEPDQPSGSAN